MTDSLAPTTLTPLQLAEHYLAAEADMEASVVYATAAYVNSGEDTPLRTPGPSGPLWYAYSELFDRLKAFRSEVDQACADAGREGWLLWEAREPSGVAFMIEHRRLFDVRYLERVKYKLAQTPALPLMPMEFRALMRQEKEQAAEPPAEASSDTAAPAPAVPDSPAPAPA